MEKYTYPKTAWEQLVVLPSYEQRHETTWKLYNRLGELLLDSGVNFADSALRAKVTSSILNQVLRRLIGCIEYGQDIAKIPPVKDIYGTTFVVSEADRHKVVEVVRSNWSFPKKETNGIQWVRNWGLDANGPPTRMSVPQYRAIHVTFPFLDNMLGEVRVFNPQDYMLERATRESYESGKKRVVDEVAEYWSTHTR